MHQLPEEVLVKIFHHLDPKTLVNATKVCDRWAKLITNAPELMKKFTLTIFVLPFVFGINDSIPNGRYRNLYIQAEKYYTSIPRKIMELIQANSQSIRFATIDNFKIFDTFNILSEITRITKLVIIDCKIENDFIGSIDFPSLNYLEISGTITILKCISSHKIDILKIADTLVSSLFSENVIEILNTFLKTCYELKYLTLSNITDTLIINLENINFNLERLVIEKVKIQDDNFKIFLKNQKDSLKALAIEESQPNSDLLRTILTEMSLIELEIDIAIVPHYYPVIFQNKSIKKLTIRGNQLGVIRDNQNIQISGQHESINKLIALCASVEEFSIYEFLRSSFDFLTSIYISNANLKILKLATVPVVISPLIHFMKLEKIEIDKIMTENDYMNLAYLVIYSPNLKILKINKIENVKFDEKFFEIIINRANNLEEFHIGITWCVIEKLKKMVLDAKIFQKSLRKISFIWSLIQSQKINDSSNDLDSKLFAFSLLPKNFFFPNFEKTLLGATDRVAVNRKLEVEDIRKQTPLQYADIKKSVNEK